ncbi:MAG: NAD(P)-binding protein, partial [Burkholderiales bacterium]
MARSRRPGVRFVNSDARYDFIIIGSGAGGGTLALKLAPSGKRILILERGDYL